jgi:hypothetical protein
MNRSAGAAIAGAVGAFALVGSFVSGYKVADGHKVAETVMQTVTSTVTQTVTVTPAGAAAPVTTPSPRPSQPPVLPALYSCEGKALTRATDYVLTCADAGMSLEGLTWSSWTATQASGTGQLRQNDCTPSCAGGTFHYSPVKVIASEPVGSPPYFQQLDITGGCTTGCSWRVGRNGPS